MEWLAFRDAAFNAGRTIYPLTVAFSLWEREVLRLPRSARNDGKEMACSDRREQGREE